MFINLRSSFTVSTLYIQYTGGSIAKSYVTGSLKTIYASNIANAG